MRPLLLALATLVFATAARAAELKITVDTGETPTLHVATKSFPIGMPAADVVRDLGKPAAIATAAEGYKMYAYPKQGIRLGVGADGKLNAIIIYLVQADGFLPGPAVLDNGIKRGAMTRPTLEKLLGKPTSETTVKDELRLTYQTPGAARQAYVFRNEVAYLVWIDAFAPGAGPASKPASRPAAVAAGGKPDAPAKPGTVAKPAADAKVTVLTAADKPLAVQLGDGTVWVNKRGDAIEAQFGEPDRIDHTPNTPPSMRALIYGKRGILVIQEGAVMAISVYFTDASGKQNEVATPDDKFTAANATTDTGLNKDSTIADVIKAQGKPSAQSADELVYRRGPNGGRLIFNFTKGRLSMITLAAY